MMRRALLAASLRLPRARAVPAAFASGVVPYRSLSVHLVDLEKKKAYHSPKAVPRRRAPRGQVSSERDLLLRDLARTGGAR